jgi:hypothetical protein
MSTDAVDLIDVVDICQDLGITEDQARRALREAIAAGLLTVDAITDTKVVLRGLVPDEERTNP